MARPAKPIEKGNLNKFNMKHFFTKTKDQKPLSAWKAIGLFTFLSLLGMQSAKAQYTAIPDANFEQAFFLQGIDSIDGDHQVLTSAISGVTSLFIGFSNIADLSGIEGFTSLQVLDCSLNHLTSINISGLTNLNVSGLIGLQNLNCSQNNLTSLNVTGLSALQTLECHFNSLTSIDVSTIIALTSFICAGNQLSSLNVGVNTSLTSFYCSDNQLTSLNVSGLTALTSFNCTNNVPSLTCITVSDPVTAASNGNWNKDATASYSTNCGASNIPTPKVKANQCGTTLSSLNANINADYYAGYQQYRFEVTNAATVNTVDVNKHNFSLTQTLGITYGTTYGIRVAVKMGGAWGAYGVSCNVTTPAISVNTVPTTTIHPNFCGATLTSLDTKIPAVLVYGATNGRYEITKSGSAPVVYEVASTTFKLSQTGVVVDYNTAYAIRVAAFVGVVWGNYGASCTVTTPSAVIDETESQNV